MTDYWLLNPTMSWLGVIALVLVVYFLFYHQG
jgi:hypothetical protein